MIIKQNYSKTNLSTKISNGRLKTKPEEHKATAKEWRILRGGPKHAGISAQGWLIQRYWPRYHRCHQHHHQLEQSGYTVSTLLSKQPNSAKLAHPKWTQPNHQLDRHLVQSRFTWIVDQSTKPRASSHRAKRRIWNLVIGLVAKEILRRHGLSLSWSLWRRWSPSRLLG